jgi:hypothetical protein
MESSMTWFSAISIYLVLLLLLTYPSCFAGIGLLYTNSTTMTHMGKMFAVLLHF